jgi:hypothetical protein
MRVRTSPACQAALPQGRSPACTTARCCQGSHKPARQTPDRVNGRHRVGGPPLVLAASFFTLARCPLRPSRSNSGAVKKSEEVCGPSRESSRQSNDEARADRSAPVTSRRDCRSEGWVFLRRGPRGPAATSGLRPQCRHRGRAARRSRCTRSHRPDQPRHSSRCLPWPPPPTQCPFRRTSARSCRVVPAGKRGGCSSVHIQSVAATQNPPHADAPVTVVSQALQRT